jgi:hypothetical protein
VLERKAVVQKAVVLQAVGQDAEAMLDLLVA